MFHFVPKKYSLNDEIVELLESISRLQRELSFNPHTQLDNVHLNQAATIDAVHFSTKIEGNRLTASMCARYLQ
jgi:hypothetical protein